MTNTETAMKALAVVSYYGALTSREFDTITKRIIKNSARINTGVPWNPKL